MSSPDVAPSWTRDRLLIDTAARTAVAFAGRGRSRGARLSRSTALSRAGHVALQQPVATARPGWSHAAHPAWTHAQTWTRSLRNFSVTPSPRSAMKWS
jgi:hypothetical protein